MTRFGGYIAAGLAAASLSAAHMIMQNPVPFSVDKLDNSPLSGGDFPCKQKLGFTVSKMNEMPVGQKQTLSFKGSAVHGGGSCQLAVTTDKTPTPQSKFKVIKSLEGGCPGVNGPSTFDFTLPKEIPNGDMVFTWTWFSKLSGQPEMYNNCAPIHVTGGASDTSGYDKLPDLFVANIPEAKGCTSPQNFDTEFPNPGNDVQKASGANLKPPTGNCGAVSGGGGGNSGGNSPSPAPAPAPASSPASAPSSGNASSPPSADSGQYTGIGSNNGGGAGNSGGYGRGGQFAPAASTTTTVVTATAPASYAGPTAPAVGGGGGGGGTGSCSTDGAVVCNGPNQFGLCNHGSVVWQGVATGTTCQDGKIQPAKRSLYRRHQPQQKHKHQHLKLKRRAHQAHI